MEGDYFDVTTQSKISIAFKNGKLLLASTELAPVSNSSFNFFSSTFTFSGDSINTELTIHTKGSKTKTYNKIKKVKLSTAELKEYQESFTGVGN